MDYIEVWLENLLVESGINPTSATYLRLLILLVATGIIAGIIYFIIKRIVVFYIYKLIKKSPIKWDDILVDEGVFNHVAHLVPAMVIRESIQSIFRDFEYLAPIVIRLTNVYLAVVSLLIILSFLRVAEFGLSKRESLKDKPLTSYFQLIRIVLYIATGIIMLSIIMSKSPVYFLSAFGAMTAILMLVFKDTILGLVASVQMSSSDMVRVGDWVEMPKFNADGDVIAINLNTVKVQNWDKTITTIPTYYFITDSFKNWRGMVESGGRRIKRALYINSQTIKFVDQETRELFKRFQLITDYVNDRHREIEEYNQTHGVDKEVLINGRRMTNIGVFRKYVEFYLKNHPGIKKDMTIMVRQLTIEEKGVPLEIYCFTSTTAWLQYESIQADVFDHLLAAAPFFGLEIFQEPTGNDFVRTAQKFKEISQTSASNPTNQ